ncbi:MAG: hypothetical protein AMXMBFR57_31510 [Acidimicrobiia bacterium]
MESRLDLREVILSTAAELRPAGNSGPNLDSTTVLQAAWRKLGARHDAELELALLTQWHDLVRTGVFAWGLNLSNPNPPWFHFTDKGRRALAKLTRDPMNPSGYFRHLGSIGLSNRIAESYILEAVDCYVAEQYKAAAVMLGVASESLLLELRDSLVAMLKAQSATYPKALTDWRVKPVADAVFKEIDSRRKNLPTALQGEFQAYWMAFVHQIRTARNEAGHPLSVEPIGEAQVHAGLLVFPEVLQLNNHLRKWVSSGFSGSAV